MYRMHRYTAMVVADEVARLYLSDDRHLLGDVQFLERADPTLCGRIEAAWGPKAKMTPRRLALALVDAKFKHVLPELLNADRQKGIVDSQLWSLLMRPEEAGKVRALCPAPTVRELCQWSKSRIHQNYSADWFLRWWAEVVRLPLYPFEMTVEMTAAGDDTWPSYVWEALHS